MRKFPSPHIFLSLALALSMAMMIGCAQQPQWVQTNAPGGSTILCFALGPDGPGGSKLFAGTGGGGVLLSTDGGASWAPTGLKEEWVTALAIGGSNIFAGTGKGVFLSTDDGGNWTPAGLAKERITTLALNGANLFAGTWDGRGIFLSKDGGKNWAAANAGLPPETAINALALGPGKDGGTNLYAATMGMGVFLSKDEGTSWAAVKGDLTSSMINALAASGTNLYAGGPSEGVFLSKDDGASWAKVNNGLTNTNVFALASSGKNLFAGTYGGGIFLSADDGTHWTAVNDGLEGKKVRTLALSPDEPGGAKLLASTQEGVFRSTRGAASWTVKSPGKTTPAPAPRGPDPYEPVKTIRAARILDGRGGVIENAVIEVTDSKITKIDQRPGPVSYDLGPATVLPGLIDVHLHLTYVATPGWDMDGPIPSMADYADAILANAQATILAGFTTVQSLGSSNDKPMRDAIAAWEIVGPRVLT